MTPDKNFISYNELSGDVIADVQAIPADPKAWSDTIKVQKCFNVLFDRFFVYGSTEDCVDVGMLTNWCTFHEFKVRPTGMYVVTCKGSSSHNYFLGWQLQGHGKAVDFEFGNWHSYNFERSIDNCIKDCYATDGKPITYCYRWGCRPIIVNTKAKHLWWRSIGITIWWWMNYLWHVTFKK